MVVPGATLAPGAAKPGVSLGWRGGEPSPTLFARVRVSSPRRLAAPRGPRTWRLGATQRATRCTPTLRIFVALGEPSPTLSVRVEVSSPRCACVRPPGVRRLRSRGPGARRASSRPVELERARCVTGPYAQCASSATPTATLTQPRPPRLAEPAHGAHAPGPALKPLPRLLSAPPDRVGLPAVSLAAPALAGSGPGALRAAR
jgi:hypothetical protein